MSATFTEPKFATHPMCADALSFWKQVYVASIARGAVTGSAVMHADDATEAYCDRCVAFAANKANPVGAKEVPGPKPKKEPASQCGDGECG